MKLIAFRPHQGVPERECREGSLVTKTLEETTVPKSRESMLLIYDAQFTDLKVPSNAEANPNLLISRRIKLSCFQRYYKKHRKLIEWKAVALEWGNRHDIGPFLWRLS
jgi:hypothetical protein